MTDRRAVDVIREKAEAALRLAGVDERMVQLAVGRMMREVVDELGVGRHYIHGISPEDRARLIAMDPRPPSQVAAEHGISVRTVHRARSRRVISSGVR